MKTQGVLPHRPHIIVQHLLYQNCGFPNKKFLTFWLNKILWRSCTLRLPERSRYYSYSQQYKTEWSSLEVKLKRRYLNWIPNHMFVFFSTLIKILSKFNYRSILSVLQQHKILWTEVVLVCEWFCLLFISEKPVLW